MNDSLPTSMPWVPRVEDRRVDNPHVSPGRVPSLRLHLTMHSSSEKVVTSALTMRH